jgi:hypothetical protein
MIDRKLVRPRVCALGASRDTTLRYPMLTALLLAAAACAGPAATPPHTS